MRRRRRRPRLLGLAAGAALVAGLSLLEHAIPPEPQGLAGAVGVPATLVAVPRPPQAVALGPEDRPAAMASPLAAAPQPASLPAPDAVLADGAPLAAPAPAEPPAEPAQTVEALPG